MIRAEGKAISRGVSVGTVLLLSHSVKPRRFSAPLSEKEETARVKEALQAVDTQLSDLRDTALQSEGEEAAAIVEIHRMMAEDEDYRAAIFDGIRVRGLSAADAVREATDVFVRQFENCGDEYMAARAADVKDIGGRLLDVLFGVTTQSGGMPVILVTDELLPSELLRFGKDRVKAVVMTGGSPTSHTAILIRSFGVPAVIRAACDLAAVRSGMPAVVNGNTGAVIFEPDERSLREAKEQMETAKKPSATGEKLPFSLYVNIADANEATEALLDRCDGVGLFRTEFLYLSRAGLPTEEEQIAAYKKVLRAAKGKPVIIRTFDLGADKPADSLPLSHEDNPALGRRGLRVYETYPAVFKTQIRALLRAATDGDLRVMYPMLTSPEELERIKTTVNKAANELEKENLPFRFPPQGVMIETPAAALLSDELAQTADFFSIGTNDLSQYTLALDRQSGELDTYADPANRAVLRLIRIAAENAHKHGIPIGICGELAAEPALAKTFAELKLDSLSVAPFMFE